VERARTRSGSSAEDEPRVQLPGSTDRSRPWRKVALLWEGEPEAQPGKGGEVRRITYSSFAMMSAVRQRLKRLGVKKGDRVTIYMPMVPEAVVAMLACARIGAPHSVIFGGFSRRRSPTASRMPRARSSSPPTAAGGAGRWCR
jgi:acetyl-CoA synthetase